MKPTTPARRDQVALRVTAGISPRASGGGLVRRSAPRVGGFALLMVVTLLAFIVLLLLGLAVYTRIETAAAGNTQRQAQARENALLGLNVALRQLQEHAGPDARVTATAAHFEGTNGTRHYTGVWNAAPPAGDSLTLPRTWLVSGNEFTVPDTTEGAAAGSRVPAPLAVTPATLTGRTVDLVARNSLGLALTNPNRTDVVAAPLVDLTATGIPGAPATANTTIGRYAWWVGDQGVKAPVAVPDATTAITFAPFDSAELRSRIRQQLPLGAGAAGATDGATLFEPQDTNNASLIAGQKVTTAGQLAFLRTPNSTAQLGVTRLQQNFHAWSPNNFAVLANTKDGGLRQDLSLAPGALGGAFAAWANYSAYMEKYIPDPPVVPADGEGGTTPAPVVSTTPPISPAYSSDPLRRRYVMTPHQIADNGAHQVAPILTYFLLTFNVRTENESTATRPLEVRARWMLSLWNPYTSALVPENLRVEVSGLPTTVRVVNETPTREGVAGEFSLRSAFGSPLRINLPWDATTIPEATPAEDRQSWLPGRVYTWRSAENTTKDSSPPASGYDSRFYSQTLSEGGAGVIRPVPDPAVMDGNDVGHLEVSGADQLTVTLYAVRPEGDVRLGRFTSPAFVDGFTTTAQEMNKSGYQFSYVFRLAESVDTPAEPGAWLTTAGRDFRRRSPPSEIFVVGENGNDPAQYSGNYSKILQPDRLLSRRTDSWTYNEDVPVFELPRAPLLSLGSLQHFRLPGQRPFMIGNPWGATTELNNLRTAALFDRFFFSGLVDGVTPATTSTGDLVLPNPLMRPLRKPDATKVTIDDIRNMATPPSTVDADGNVIPGPPGTAFSSQFFLQGGAFNLNSVNAAAWAAVLRSVRFPTAQKAFNYLNVTEATGTAGDGEVASVQSGDAQFFRFSLSAQETYKAESGQSAPGEDSAITPPNTHLFRRGMRTLSGAQVAALAAKIAELVGVKQAAADPLGGPFRSLEEFLTPSALFAGVDSEGNALAPRSLLEAAIADAGTNADIAEFSSQWLTQGDVMTALAPILFPRSDTFVIRSYGEAVNPATSATEGRAWCEAIVQRVPEYFDKSMAVDSLPGAFEPVPDPNDPTLPATSTQAQDLNKRYGRRFKVVSFRWLTRSDI